MRALGISEEHYLLCDLYHRCLTHECIYRCKSTGKVSFALSDLNEASLYEAIVDEVVNQSRQDFQDDGITEATLQEFKTRWNEKIAATGATALPDATSAKQDNLKTESNAGTPPATFSQGGNALAAMRAAQQIQQLQARSNGGIQQHQADTAVAHLMQQAQGSDSSALQDGENGNSNGDLVNVKQEPDLPNSMNPQDLSLSSSSSTTTNGKKRSLSIKSDGDKPRSKKNKAPRADIDLDDEAINSDLDDSDDDALRGEGEDEQDGDVQTVLCLFDKVQRTKNKWKCILKDGIVNVNGRDFAFNKANGEFEW
ncbi:Putative uncharacterized protein [Taphrina deformans PYCC 5710]|uniref:Transcription factor IIA, alpha/beta subunit n=1 Tax=Taphrina deformans (strain PYCC 5710 / ATCC 11124 / CBS 356.35 / IMI 108563 / JCM 9778 / NBRC 8474) TaxID=1097556 RepID=R4XA79_TAPDE|nr:Putative uncharacterized protein [Taphrina deformans PYCC 5710]|eukprot:CCG82422.1 Putative uncharacterized protein [Taphrina deformans PYCC 5710]